MQRQTFLLSLLTCLCGRSIAADIVTDIGHDGRANRIVVSQNGKTSLVEIYEEQKLIGKFSNLIVKEETITSDVIPTLGGGVSIQIDSNGSRNKYNIIIPIYKEGNRFYIKCVYKTVYDSVDEEKSVGASCSDIDLDKFDIDEAINDKVLFKYEENPSWLKNIPLKNCPNPAGFTYGSSHIVNCSKDESRIAKKSKIIAFNGSGETIFSIDGYEFFPGKDGDAFVLSSDLDDKVIYFPGSLACIKAFSTTQAPASKAVLGGKFDINYSIRSEHGCYTGSYFYTKKKMPLNLAGRFESGINYLTEYDESKRISGLFILNKADNALNGTWVGAPANKPLSVN